MLYSILGIVLMPVCKLSNKMVLAIAVFLMLLPVEWGKFMYALMHPEYVASKEQWLVHCMRIYPYMEGTSFWEMVKSNLWDGQLYSLLWALKQPIKNRSTNRQKKRSRKSFPFLAWLSNWMKKLKPNSRAKIAYAFPEKRKNKVSHTPLSKAFIKSVVASGKLYKLKCSILCNRIIAITANPRNASTTSIRGRDCSACSMI